MSTVNFSQAIAETIEAQLKIFEENAGIGPDFYNATPCVHPMAEAKFLRTLSVLYKTNKITQKQLLQRVSPSIDRLAKTAIHLQNDAMAWGLGFSWGTRSSAEPYLITTALVAAGLTSIRECTPGTEQSNHILNNSLLGLQHWCDVMTVPAHTSVNIPQYSPSIAEPIYNAAASALTALLNATAYHPVQSNQQDKIKDRTQLLEWIISQYSPKIGWPYAPKNSVVDLIHQGYILNAAADLLGVKSIETKCIELIGQLTTFCGMADALRIHSSPNALFEKDIPCIREVEGSWVEVLPKAARLWSYGEFLVVVSRLARESENSQAWYKFGHRLAQWILDLYKEQHQETFYPRHSMHALHGLASFLSVMRERTSSRSNADKATS